MNTAPSIRNPNSPKTTCKTIWVAVCQMTEDLHGDVAVLPSGDHE